MIVAHVQTDDDVRMALEHLAMPCIQMEHLDLLVITSHDDVRWTRLLVVAVEEAYIEHITQFANELQGRETRDARNSSVARKRCTCFSSFSFLILKTTRL